MIILCYWLLFGALWFILLGRRTLEFMGCSKIKAAICCILLGPIGWTLGILLISVHIKMRNEEFPK